MPTNTETYLTVKEVATVLRVNASLVRHLIRDGALPAHRIGERVLRVAGEDLRAYINRATLAPKTEEK